MSRPSRTIAVLGASNDRRKFGNKAVRAFAAAGWRVFPVHPREPEVEGLTAFPHLAALPESVEVITVYLPPALGLRLLPEIAAAQAREVWFNPGADSAALRDEAARLKLPVRFACSIVAYGLSPREFADA